MGKLRVVMHPVRRHRTVFLFAAAFAVVGAALILMTRAATPAQNAIEPESGSPAGNTLVSSDASAASGHYVNFLAQPTGGGGYSPPVLPGPSCASIAHGGGPWEAIDPSCVKIRDFNDPGNNYGAQIIAVSKSNPNIIMVGTNYQGVWRSTDRGNNWTRTNTVNKDGFGGCNTFDGRNWALAIDPDDPNHVIAANGYGCLGSGGWQTYDGGVTWQALMPTAFVQSIGNSGIYSIAFDPWNSKHILTAFHDRWNSGSSGVAESTDGGQTWTAKQPKGTWGSGHYVHFLNNSDSWLVATQEDGLWRTTDRGTNWTKVSTESMQHGMNQLYKSANGSYYIALVSGVFKSANQGAGWSLVFARTCTDGFGGIIGDGTRMYVAPANTGGTSCGISKYYSALESNDTSWTEFGNQTFSDGPMNFAIDPTTRTIYSSNWNGGIWRLTY